ncbi:MAG: hypothetical protein EXX96DRAFT_545381 [Benjaminiella poitrasii]|nr:MAG: hypothetical protein EXX96DRAFT_545381 [Benjaminiella poitrasii]
MVSNNHPHSYPPPQAQAPVTSIPPPSSLSEVKKRTISTTTATTAQSLLADDDVSPYRPLNVTDALTYLDQVKTCFIDQPIIYNKFLDIMKDFKSQTIETPGVIERVSILFKGHPELIHGFNTFLPSGYSIEYDPRDRNGIIVITPTNNTTTTNQHSSLLHLPPPIPPPAHYLQQQQAPYLHSPSSYGGPSLPSITNFQSHSPSAFRIHSISAMVPFQGMTTAVAPPSCPPIPLPPPHHHHSSSSTTHQLSHPPPPPLQLSTTNSHEPSSLAATRYNQKDFRNAIDYVNKIKNRFMHNNPEIYTRFLEILQIYRNQNESTSAVYLHMKALFSGLYDAEELLYEFKQFLPEMEEQEEETKRAMTGPAHKRVKRTRPQQQDGHETSEKMNDEDEDDSQTSSNTAAVPHYNTNGSTVTKEEIELFEKIKRHIGNKPSYEAFLKTLQMYTLEIISLEQLVEQIEKVFLATNPALLKLFKVAVGHEDRHVRRELNKIKKPDLNQSRPVTSSPSYHAVPKEWQSIACSGRDQMCWEVLNDEYVSHPIWASEDTGFVASKKNQYEEALHQCEEERYEYDLLIDANSHAISLLQPILTQTERQMMTQEERNRFCLQLVLNDLTSHTLRSVINKIYGEDRGREIMEVLYRRPAQVIPTLIRRLELKDKEWRRGRKEWNNKVWREWDEKNYYRSLDYQANTFKLNDRRAMATKSLLLSHHSRFPLARQSAKVARDMTRLVSLFMDHQPLPLVSHYSSGGSSSISSGFDRRAILDFLQNALVPAFFGVLQEPLMAFVVDLQDSDDDASFSPSWPSFDRQQVMEVMPYFCNSNYYCLFRLYHLLYERLCKLKTMSEEQSDNDLGLNSIAVRLNLISNRFEDIDLSKGKYEALLDVIERFIEAEYDQATFEENARFIYGTEAYIIFTIDKLLYSLIKQIQVVMADKKSIELFNLLNSGRYDDQLCAWVESVLETDGHVYKVEYLDTVTTIQYIDKTKASSLFKTQQELYASSFQDWNHGTRGMKCSILKPSFLKRNLRRHQTIEHKVISTRLLYKINPKTYQIHYIVGSEDYLLVSRRKENNSNVQRNEWLITKQVTTTATAEAELRRLLS